MFIYIFWPQLRNKNLALKMSRMYSSYIKKNVIIHFESQYDSISKFFNLLYIKMVITEKNKMECTKIIFICLYRFFDTNSERTIWLLKWAECIPLTYRRRLSLISSHNRIVFSSFLASCIWKLCLQKNKTACT